MSLHCTPTYQTIESILHKKRNKKELPKNESLIELLRLVLTRNYFQFNGENYLQIGGTAMGTRVAPAYANHFMQGLDEHLLSEPILQPRIWLRYIDDIFFIWEHTEPELIKWHQHLNSIHNTIKFTMEHSRKETSFLDTLVKIDKNSNLYTDLYTKDTDSHNYLMYDSAHPPHCKKNLPYGQFLRLRRICSKDTDYKTHAKNMKLDFIERGYPHKALNRDINRCQQIERDSLLKPKDKSKETDSNKTFLVQTFRPCKDSLTETVRKNWEILGKSKTTKNLYRSELTCSYKKPKSIRDYLVKARVDYHPENQPCPNQVEKESQNACKKANCKYCNLLVKTGTVKSKTTKETYISKHNITCNSSNLIYCIECSKCKIQYVGQTKRKIKERIREHLYHTKKGVYNSDVAYHFDKSCAAENLTVHIVDFIYEHPDSKRAKILRNKIEYNWVHKLKSVTPNGLNTQDNLYG